MCISTTSDKVRQMVADQEYRKALSVVKGFRLGITKKDSAKMTRAYECMNHAGFYRQLGYDPESEIADGIAVLKKYYGKVDVV